jgi:hypothetical protein
MKIVYAALFAIVIFGTSEASANSDLLASLLIHSPKSIPNSSQYPTLNSKIPAILSVACKGVGSSCSNDSECCSKACDGAGGSAQCE